MEPRSVLGRVCYLRARSVAAFSVGSYELLDVKTKEFIWWSMGYLHPQKRHPRYMGSFVDYLVAIRETAGDMKLRQFCFASLIPTVCWLVSSTFEVT